MRELAKKIPGARRVVRALRKMKAGPSTPTLHQHAVPKTKNERYDEETLGVIKRVVRPDSVCVDVGAHIGSILQAMIEQAPRATHIAIEPLPDLAQGLREKFPNAIVHECALSDRTGEAEFQHVTNARGYSGLRQRTYDRPDPIIEKIPVRVERLDDLIPPSVSVALIKIDIEGGEYHALKGAGEILARDRPVVVFEAGTPGASHYGVNQDMIFDFFQDHRMCVSTMKRWLAFEPPFSREAFRDSWSRDFFFIAYPPS